MMTVMCGPYNPPKCRVGSMLHDEMLGDVRVVGKKNGWPLCDEPPRPGPNPFGEIPVLCGDLVKAIVEESIDAICEEWEVSPRLVRRWRSAVAGTDKGVSTALALKRFDTTFRKKFY